MDFNKNFIPVVAKFDTQGGMTPLAIEWHGLTLSVDKVLDRRMAPSLKHGGYGMRFTIRIRNTLCYLFCDEGKWFLEK